MNSMASASKPSKVCRGWRPLDAPGWRLSWRERSKSGCHHPILPTAYGVNKRNAVAACVGRGAQAVMVEELRRGQSLLNNFDATQNTTLKVAADTAAQIAKLQQAQQACVSAGQVDAAQQHQARGARLTAWATLIVPSLLCCDSLPVCVVFLSARLQLQSVKNLGDSRTN